MLDFNAREFHNLVRALGGWGKDKNSGAANFRFPSEGAAEGGCGGNSAAPERNQTEASPAALLVPSRATQKSFLFLLEEKIGARKSGKAKKTFLWGSAGFPHGGGAASLVPFKVGSRKVYNYSIIKITP